MNERTAPPVAPVPQPRPSRPPPILITGSDREFLPAALEILETPPPPLPIALMATISAFALAALVWSYFGRLDVHATAPGKIETAGYAKVIEPLDPGKISAIHVEKGQTVKAGDLLLELDPAEADADARSSQNALNASAAEMARRRYAINAVRAAEIEVEGAQDRLDARSKDDAPPGADSGSVESLAGRADLKIAWDTALPEQFQLREEAVLRADLAQLSDALKALDRQMAEKLATQKRLNMSIAFQNKLMETLNQRVSTRQQAIDLNVGTKIDLYNAKEETVSQFIADNENKLADAARKADESRQALAKADARLARTRLYAPTDGVIQQMAVTTVGQVVTTGQQLVVLTPIGSKLQVEALVANLDIGFVKPGQDAVIKIDAFPFTRFGALHGKVVNIASSAIAEQDAKRALANATATANVGQEAPTAPGQPESFVFPVTVSLDESAMKIDNATIPLTPGMTATVEIRTDSRRVIDYLLSPLAKIGSEALRER
jgi:hemolysin D